MDITAVFKAVLAPDQERAAEQFAHLKVGDRLSGRVLKLEADGRLLIDMGRFKALADTTLPVQVGQRLTLKVTRMGVPIQLRLESDTQAAAPQLAHPRMTLATLLSTGDQQRVINTVERLLNAMPSAPPATPLGDGGRIQTAPAQSATASMESPAVPEAPPLAKGTWPEPVRQALTQLKAVFDPMPLEAPAAQRTQWVQATVEDRGILFELKLADAVEQTSGRPEPAQVPTGAAKPMAPLTPETLQSARAASEIRMGVDRESPTGPDAKLALGLKVQAGSRGELESIIEKSAAPPPAADVLAAEQAQRIIARDLKPHLLVLKNFLGGLEEQGAGPLEAHAKDVAFLRQAVNQLTTHVEQQQEQAVRRAGEPDLYQVFTHLLPVKEQQPVQLKVYYPKKGRAAEGDPQHRVSLLLMLDRLGPVRADLAMVERSLRIGFYVRDPQVQQVFEQHVQTVSDALAGVFDQVQISTQVSREKIAQFEGEDLMGPPVGRIDVQV